MTSVYQISLSIRYVSYSIWYREAMSNESAAPAPREGRPRSDQVDQAILHAASALLVERGLDAMTIEDVAARAGVGKSSIYRRWPTKGTLALDAFLDSLSRPAAPC